MGLAKKAECKAWVLEGQGVSKNRIFFISVLCFEIYNEKLDGFTAFKNIAS